MYKQLFCLIVFCSSSRLCAMEIGQQTPQVWVESLDEFLRNKQEHEFDLFFADVKKQLMQEEPKVQLNHYKYMIEQAVLKENKFLTIALSEALQRLYSTHFQSTTEENDTFPIMQGLIALLERKKHYNKALNNLRVVSCTAALPPLAEIEPLQSPKKHIADDQETSSEPISEESGIKNLPLALPHDHSIMACTFMNNCLVVATNTGEIFSYDIATGSCRAQKQLETFLPPLCIISGALGYDDKKENFHIAHFPKTDFGFDISVVYGKKNGRLKCIMLNDNENFVIGHDDGKIEVENSRTKQSNLFKGHQGTITALLAYKNSAFFSASHDGTIREWDCKKGKCIKTLNSARGAKIQAITFFNHMLLSLRDHTTIDVWDTGKNASFVFYKNSELIKTIIGFHQFFIAGFKNGSLRVWHKDEGSSRSLSLEMAAGSHLKKLKVYKDRLIALYKKGTIILFPYEFFVEGLQQAQRNNFVTHPVNIPQIIINEKN